MDYVEVELELPKPPSLNMIYAGKHWAVRKKYKDDYKKECQKQLAKLDNFVCSRIHIFILTIAGWILTTVFWYQNF